MKNGKGKKANPNIMLLILKGKTTLLHAISMGRTKKSPLLKCQKPTRQATIYLYLPKVKQLKRQDILLSWQTVIVNSGVPLTVSTSIYLTVWKCLQCPGENASPNELLQIALPRLGNH